MIDAPATREPGGLWMRHGGPALAGLAPYALIVACVWLAWQILTGGLADRLPVGIALRIAPESSSVLTRAGEEELAAGREANAAELGRLALARAPFNVRALRVIGLAEDRGDGAAEADDIVTLAANWSLRDDPSHAWLIERRLRQGNYTSAFAHADTLARRREDIRPHIFALFTTAVANDLRSFGPVVRLVAVEPPWRTEFLEYLYNSPQGLGLAVNLAIALNNSSGRLNNLELRSLYVQLMLARQYKLMREVRARLARPPITQLIVNGSFSGQVHPEPFTWKLYPSSGVISEIIESSPDGGLALRVQYDGYQSADIAEQLLLLEPGRYRLSGRARAEVGDMTARLKWVVTCREGVVVGRTSTLPSSADWATFDVLFEVPTGCDAQTLKLVPQPGDRRSTVVGWFDDLTISPQSRTPQ